MSKIYSFFLWLFLFRSIGGIAQAQYHTQTLRHGSHFTTEQGLSHNDVPAIVKDSEGFVWVGTGYGLNRFDGYSFVKFSNDDRDSLSLSNNVVRCMLLDSYDRLWVGTYNGLNLYNSETETFQRFLQNSDIENSITQNTILCLLEDSRQNLWVGTFGGLNKINLETLNITRYFYESDGTGLANNAVHSVLEDREGKIWACTAGGVNIIGSGGIEKTIAQSSVPGGLSDDLILTVKQDSTGAIFFGTNGGGILLLDDENDTSFERFTTRSPRNPIGSNFISKFSIDHKGRLLVGTDGAGLYLYKGDGEFVQLPGKNNPILDNSNIQEIFVDERNNYWLGLYGSGFIFVPGYAQRFKHYRYFDPSMEETGKNSVLSIVEDHDQKIWLGTDGSGLFQFDPEKETFTSFLPSPSNKNSLSTNVVKSLTVDDHNNLYIGTFGGGLNYFDTRAKTFTRYLHDPTDSNSISTNHAWSLLRSRAGQIYVGLLGGFDEFIPEQRIFKPLRITGEKRVTKFTASIFSIKEDREGNIWLGTRLAGIHRYQPKTQSFLSFLNVPGDTTSFPSNEILVLQNAKDGKLLIGTDSKGLLEFDPVSFRSAQVVPQFRNKSIQSVLEDDHDNLWFTSFDGLHRFNKTSGETNRYLVADGLQGVQFNESAALKTSDGKFYFGGTNGLNVFDPNKMDEDTIAPKVVFTRLNLFHDEVRVGDESNLLHKSISKTKEIIFEPYQNVFSIEFACVEYKFPKRNKYRYYLKEFERGWNTGSESRTATYTNLPPGKYTLLVSASSANGYWGNQPARMQIVVLPFWYQRPIVKAGFVVLVVIAIIVLFNIRTRFLVKQKRRLEHMVRLRTHLIGEQNQEIQDKNKRLEMAYEEVNTINEQLQTLNLNLEGLVEKRTRELEQALEKLMETNKGLDTFLYRSSHDLRGPIVSMIGLAQLGKMEDAQECRDVCFDKLEERGTGMLRLLEMLSETGSLFRWTPTIKKIDVQSFIESIKADLKKLDPGNTVSLDELLTNQIKSFSTDPVLLSLVVRNLIENSIVFRNDNEAIIKISIKGEDGQLFIEIFDNGIGIDPAIKDRIFEEFFRGSEKSIGNGLGLFMVSKALDILEGSIEVDSVPKSYTKVSIRLPDRQT